MKRVTLIFQATQDCKQGITNKGKELANVSKYYKAIDQMLQLDTNSNNQSEREDRNAIFMFFMPTTFI